jgi:hypothetical protein
MDPYCVLNSVFDDLIRNAYDHLLDVVYVEKALAEGNKKTFAD